MELERMYFITITLIGISFCIYWIYLIVQSRLQNRSIDLFSKKTLLLFALIISVLATTGSLYYSEVKGYEPCKLCWFQRIFMYPLVILFFIAWRRESTNIFRYTLPLSLMGGSVALYHYVVQMMPKIFSSSASCEGVSCLLVHVNEFGFITIPFMALVAFLAIALVGLSSRYF